MERGLYLLISLMMWVIGLIGFWPGYLGPMLSGTLDKTGAVHLHVVVYVGWMILFTVQSTLPMARRGRLHRKIGRFGIGYGVLVWIMGLFVTFSRFADRVRLGDLDEARLRTLAPFTDMLLFPILFALAIHYRTQPELHKRFMVLAGTMLMVAAVARLALNGIIPQNAFLFLGIWLSPVFVAVAHDAWFQRRLHPVYGFGLLALSVVPSRMALAETEAWRSITAWAARTLVS
jgi:hypothetical protein